MFLNNIFYEIIMSNIFADIFLKKCQIYTYMYIFFPEY